MKTCFSPRRGADFTIFAFSKPRQENSKKSKPKPLQKQHKNVRKHCGKHTTKMEPKNDHFRSQRGAKNDPKIDQNGAMIIHRCCFFSQPAKSGPRAAPRLPKWSQKWPFWEPWGSRNQAKRAPRHLFNHYIRWVLPAHQRASAATHQSHHFDSRWLPNIVAKWHSKSPPSAASDEHYTFCVLSAHCSFPLHHSRENPFNAAFHGAPSHYGLVGKREAYTI